MAVRAGKRSNATHASTTDPDARLYRKGNGRESKLCYMGHALTEKRHGLAVGGGVTIASGTAEREAALDLIDRHRPVQSRGGRRRITVGGDKGFDVAGERSDVHPEHGCQWRAIPKDLPPRSTLFGYFELWDYDGTLDRIHHSLYVKCREAIGREASPTACVIDSQSVKGAEKGGPASIRRATMRVRRSKVRSATSLSTR